jgi:hypothetical protein
MGGLFSCTTLVNLRMYTQLGHAIINSVTNSETGGRDQARVLSLGSRPPQTQSSGASEDLLDSLGPSSEQA